MRVTVLDDYQQALASAPAIKRLEQHAEVQILTEKLPSQDALVRVLAGSHAVIPIRERTRFNAPLLKQLPDLELISQTG
ncbi:MAG TPA: D-2-hydroxyacid dehydrogenase family protein, partial [Candidatus Binatia bacterium]|nr:D-2-hydroxyacid dehydrogenase family protein [Candidatus Binatia bacterium]